jgi:hypothetical protein
MHALELIAIDEVRACLMMDHVAANENEYNKDSHLAGQGLVCTKNRAVTGSNKESHLTLIHRVHTL